ncbi:hypothetical protein K443DRAFT_682448 [Laccaria amethystina LaAM-08-1]|jgi:acetyl esterase/lipase|uniref:Unplaced genomic scaffold K443scaffold_194, whole genome shotgun sequence n=1 Tax=Laccaria amethystina LaAM-08-1 TaxID=1095629 RepID=A0A0C9XJ09_9AGAR|nr:hypothetical protein K443DRAFT_682448 [Laccaria amethystina LaAM-08-1]
MASRKYADVSWLDIGQLSITFLKIPFVIGWNVVRFLFTSPPFRGIGRNVSILGIKFLLSHSSLPQLQYVGGTTLGVYKAWVKKKKLPITVEELGEDTRLLWVGPKQTKRVVLYFHGGGYILPLQDFSLRFWRYVQLELQKRDCDVGFAILNYSLYPVASFPTPMRQATLVLDHLLALGVHPSNLQIVGDSAGGNLILQLISNLLHPLDPSIKIQTPLKSPIRGVYLMSPWVHIHADDAAYSTNRDSDLLAPSFVLAFGQAIKDDVPISQRPYFQPSSAPSSWFDDIHTVVDRILLTAGDVEIFRDDITHFSKVLAKGKGHFRYVTQEHGIHDDPFYDFLFSETPAAEELGTLTPLIIDWLESGFSLVDPDT